MPENPFPPPPPWPPPEPPPLPPVPEDPAPESALVRWRRQAGELLAAWRDRIPRRWRRPLLLATLCLTAIGLGLCAGRSAFQAPEAPTFEPRDEPLYSTPVEAVPNAPVEVQAAPPPRLPTTPGDLETDATDYELLGRIRGEWQIDLGGRGEARVTFTDEVVSQVKEAGFLVRVYRSVSRQLPERFSVVRVPDGGGNFIAFHGDGGETRDVFENVELAGRDVFAFTEATSGRRRYARRTGSALPPPTDVAGAPLPAPGEEPAASWQEPEPTTLDDERGEAEEEEEDGDELENLWKIARAQRERKQYGPLVHTLDRILEINPRHPLARRWKNEIEQQLRSQNREALNRTQDLLDDLADAIEDRDLDELRRLWGGRFDNETSRFFTQLFRRYSKLKVRASLVSVTVEAKAATGFVASLSIEGRERGRRAETEEYAWRGRLQDGRFASPFP